MLLIRLSVWGLCGALLSAPAWADSAQSIPVLGRGDGGVVVHRHDLLSDVQHIPEASRGIFLTKPDNLLRVTEGVAVRRSLAARGAALKLDEDPQVQAELQLARDRVLSQAYLRYLDRDQPPSEQVLERLAMTRYQADPSQFAVPAQTRARHILLSKEGADARAQAEALLQELRAGADFAKLAQQYSVDYASAARGGDLGFFGAGRMVAPFEEAVNALKQPGELSPIVETQFGYHIIRLEERREAKTLSFDEVKDQLKAEALAALRREKREHAIAQARNAFQANEAALAELAAEFERQLNTRP